MPARGEAGQHEPAVRVAGNLLPGAVIGDRHVAQRRTGARVDHAAMNRAGRSRRRGGHGRLRREHRGEHGNRGR